MGVKLNLYDEYKIGDTEYRVAMGDIFDMENIDGIGFTTNGYVNKKGLNIMGVGIAKDISRKYTNIPMVLGKMIKTYGNNVYRLIVDHGVHIFNIPVKPSMGDIKDKLPYSRVRYMGNSIPGYAVKADVNLIEQSVVQLVRLVNDYDLKNVAIPLLGCGAGGLGISDIRYILDEYLDNRFIVCSYKLEDLDYVSNIASI